MTQINLLFRNLKPFSANEDKSFNKKGKYYKSTKKDNFQKQVYCEMLRRKPDLFTFEAIFSPYDHVLIGTLYVFMPKNKLFTTKDCLSKTGGDVNNNKTFTDSIFKCMDKLDDAYLLSEPPFKLISPDKNYHMGYILEIFDKENVERWSKNAWEKINQ